MRIVVIDIAASEGGALTLLESFHRYVREFDTDNEWVFLLGSDLLEGSDRIRTVVLAEVKANWLRRLAFDLVSGRRLIRTLKPDLVLSLQNTYTYGLKCPQVVYVHQSLPFQHVKNFSMTRPGERRLAFYQHVIGAIIKQSVCRADHVIVQTRWMRDAILDQVNISNDRVSVIAPDLEDLSAYRHVGDPVAGSFFYPTADLSYKNNEVIYAACRLLREQGTDHFTVRLTIDSSISDPNVEAIGRVSRERVMAELSCSTLIFPSLIESYGLPLVEARALGALILAADLPYARETLDGYGNAYFFDPASPVQLAALMARALRHDLPVVCLDHKRQIREEEGTTGWSAVRKVIEKSVRERIGR